MPSGSLRLNGKMAGAVAAILLGFALLCGRFAWTTSATFDEPGLIYSGYANWRAGVAKSSTANLIFAQSWCALPLLLQAPRLPTDAEVAAEKPENRELGRMMLYHEGNDWRALLRPARAMTILLAVILGAAIFAWARQLFGNAGGFVALLAYCLSPVILSNAALATTDLATAFWFTVATAACWRLMHRIGIREVILAGAAAGLLFVTKFSAFAIVPVVVVLAVLRLAIRRPLVVTVPGIAAGENNDRLRQLAWLIGAAAAAGCVALGMIWLCYAPQMIWFAAKEAPLVGWEQLSPHGLLSQLAIGAHRMGLLPDLYLRDLWYFDATTAARRAYLMGQYTIGGWWYFFPVAAWFKTPLPAWIAVAMAFLAAGQRGWLRLRTSAPKGQADTGGGAGPYELLPWIVLIAVYGAIAMASNVNLGIRHLLPLYPAGFILTGLMARVSLPARWRVAIPAVLLGWSGLEVLSVRGEYLSYCNEFGGGSSAGHRILVDSSYEWGQDLPAVERWVAARRAVSRDPLYLSYFGNADLRRFDLGDVVLLPQFFDLRTHFDYPLRPGTYLISATMLHSMYGPLFGPWRATYEQLYQALLAEDARSAGDKSAPALTPEVQNARKVVFDALRFNRLCAYLRRRGPDGRVTNGVLLYELTADDLTRALSGPLPENDSKYEVRGTELLPQEQLGFLK